jgi:glycolate oxidase FAD binding subunit
MSSPAPLPARAAGSSPATEEEVVALIKNAAASGVPLATIGSNTKRQLGPAVRADATVVSLRQLARVTSYEPGDMVVSVQPGVRLTELQRMLAQRGQWLPIDPPHLEATMGGILATASNGPRRLGYGAAKDHLIGMRVAGATGVVTKSGGRVVKNVTGYDLHKLHVGAFGSLGVILEAHFKVQPRPELSGAVILGAADYESAHQLLLEIWGSALRPVALEAFNTTAAGSLRGLAAGIPASDALAVVGIEGSRPVFERHLRELEAWRPRTTGMAVLRGPAAEGLWAALRDLPDRRRDEITVRVGARPHDLPALLRAASAVSGAAVQASAGNGLARVGLRRAPAADLARQVQAWHEQAAARGGYAVVESAPLDLDGRATLPFAGPGPALGETLKKKWDPAQLLNPGRMPL